MNLTHSNNWRARSSADALQYLIPHLSSFGITRIANITGLDFSGVPVYTAFRPRASTLAVSCGKGLTHEDSIVSSVMESIEADVAERIDSASFINTTYDQIDLKSRVPLSTLPLLSNHIFSQSTPYSWLPCQVLGTSSVKLLPAATISLAYSMLVDPLMTFVWGTNGLASGLTQSDAILSALYEYIERDALLSWKHLLATNLVKEAMVDLSTIPFTSTQALVSLILDGSFRLYLFDRSSDLGLPVYRAVIHSPGDTTIPTSEGYGCHHLDEVAINRAITEAVQSRTVIIAGSRDDISFRQLRSLSSRSLPSDFADLLSLENFIPSGNAFHGPLSAIDDIQKRLAEKGLFDVYLYSFPIPGDTVSVVRVFIPGLQHYSHRHAVPTLRFAPFKPRLHGLREALFQIRTA